MIARRSIAARASAGFSLVELAITVVLLVIVLATALRIGTTIAQGSSTANAASEADASVGRAIERMSRALQDSGTGWCGAVVPGVSYDDVSYRRVVGWDVVAGIQTIDERIFLERSPSDADDGIDNDTNGIVDDCRVVWVRSPGQPDQMITIVTDRVPEFLEGEIGGNLVDDNDNGLIDERGLALDFAGSGVRVQLTVVERDGEQRDVVRTASRTVWFRNEAASFE